MLFQIKTIDANSAWNVYHQYMYIKVVYMEIYIWIM